MKYISLLRGINVGGHKKIKMADLRAMYESLEFENVTSYIQSGNVLFESSSGDVSALVELLETEIEKTFGFFVPVIIRTAPELAYAIANNPFPDVPEEKYKFLHVAFLSEEPTPENKATLGLEGPEGEQIVFGKTAVYLYYPNGSGRSKISNNTLEKSLKVRSTMRNWKSVNKLFSMAND